MRAPLSPNPIRLGLGFHQRWRLLSSAPFHVALRSLDVAPQHRVLSAISSPVALIGLGRVLCTGIMGGQGRSVTMLILVDRIFLWCCPLLLVAAEKVDWQKEEVQGGVSHCFVPFSSVSKLHVAITGSWRRRPPKSWVYCLVSRSFANHAWAWALFGLRFGNVFVWFRVYPLATPSLRRKGKEKL